MRMMKAVLLRSSPLFFNYSYRYSLSPFANKTSLFHVFRDGKSLVDTHKDGAALLIPEEYDGGCRSSPIVNGGDDGDDDGWRHHGQSTPFL